MNSCSTSVKILAVNGCKYRHKIETEWPFLIQTRKKSRITHFIQLISLASITNDTIIVLFMSIRLEASQKLKQNRCKDYIKSRKINKNFGKKRKLEVNQLFDIFFICKMINFNNKRSIN